MDEKKNDRINHHKGDIRREMLKSHLAFHRMHTDRGIGMHKDWTALALQTLWLFLLCSLSLFPLFAEINHEYCYPSVWDFFYFNFRFDVCIIVGASLTKGTINKEQMSPRYKGFPLSK